MQSHGEWILAETILCILQYKGKNSPKKRKLSLQSKTLICAVAMPAELVVAVAIR